MGCPSDQICFAIILIDWFVLNSNEKEREREREREGKINNSKLTSISSFSSSHLIYTYNDNNNNNNRNNNNNILIVTKTNPLNSLNAGNKNQQPLIYVHVCFTTNKHNCMKNFFIIEGLWNIFCTLLHVHVLVWKCHAFKQTMILSN